jgi:hypothetical protein
LMLWLPPHHERAKQDRVVPTPWAEWLGQTTADAAGRALLCSTCWCAWRFGSRDGVVSGRDGKRSDAVRSSNSAASRGASTA